MLENKYYCCNVTGSGKLTWNSCKKIRFQIIDLRAEGAKISLSNELPQDAHVKLVIILPSLLFQVQIKTDAKVIQKISLEKGYEYYVEFIGLSERDKIEIDDLLRSACT